MPRDGDLPRGGRAGQPAAVRADQSRRVQERRPAREADPLSGPAAAGRRVPAAVSLDFWDTIYVGAASAERVQRRQAALLRLLGELGHEFDAEHFDQVYRASGEEAERWWREEHRGYTTEERVRWMLMRLGVERPSDCAHVKAAVQAMDDVLLDVPPEPLPGAVDAVRRLAARFPLAIVSDTGFASGKAQDRLLERDGLLELFRVRVYSMDIGHAKPRREPFDLAVRMLGVPAREVVHVGDNERTDVRGALAAGMRAVRLDVVRDRGGSAAELVARSLDELVAYLTGEETAPQS